MEGHQHHLPTMSDRSPDVAVLAAFPRSGDLILKNPVHIHVEGGVVPAQQRIVVRGQAERERGCWRGGRRPQRRWGLSGQAGSGGQQAGNGGDDPDHAAKTGVRAFLWLKLALGQQRLGGDGGDGI